MEKEIAIIGCGVIGGELARAIDSRTIPNCSLTAIFDIDPKKSKAVNEKLNNKATLFSNFQDFIKSPQFNKIDMVIEAASIDAASIMELTFLKKEKT